MGVSPLLGMAYIGVEIGPLVYGTLQIESAYMVNIGRTVAVSTVVYFLVFRRRRRSRSPPVCRVIFALLDGSDDGDISANEPTPQTSVAQWS